MRGRYHAMRAFHKSNSAANAGSVLAPRPSYVGPTWKHAKAAVLNNFNSVDAKRGYGYAIDEFVDWYSLKSRLAQQIP